MCCVSPNSTHHVPGHLRRHTCPRRNPIYGIGDLIGYGVMDHVPGTRYQLDPQPSPPATHRQAAPREEWIDIPVPALVDPTLFEATQRQLEENRRGRRRERRHQSRLAAPGLGGLAGVVDTPCTAELTVAETWLAARW